jgi:hypothetical protein
MTLTPPSLRLSELASKRVANPGTRLLLDLRCNLQVTTDKSVAPGEKVSQFYTTEHVEPIL